MSQEDLDFAKQILEEINKLRKDPKIYIKILQEHLNYFDGNALYVPDSKMGGVMLDEGPKAYLEAISYLKNIKEQLKPLNWNENLYKAAQDHVNDIGSKGILSHVGSNKSSYKDRIEKYCKWGGSIFEAMNFGPRDKAQDVVIAWLVDDGVPKRSHRINITSADLHEVGIASGDHKQAENCNVAVFACQAISLDEYNKNYTDQTALVDQQRKDSMQKKDWVKFAKEVFDLQNKVRQNPKSFIPILDKALFRFNGKVLMSEDGKSGVETQEGNIAYVEAIEFLQIMRPVAPLQWSNQLARAAQDHINDIGPKGIVSSLGSDGSLPTDRLARYCNIDDAWGESLAFQSVSAKEVIERLIVDDGQPARGYRKSFFNPELLHCGIATGIHATMDNVILLEYSSAILKDGEMPSINVTVSEEIPSELIDKIVELGIDVSKIKVKKDTKDATLKAQQLFKKATSAITMTNRMKPATATIKETPTQNMPATKGMTSPKSSIGSTKIASNTTTTAPTNRPTTAFNKAKSIPVSNDQKSGGIQQRTSTAAQQQRTTNSALGKASTHNYTSTTLKDTSSPFKTVNEEEKVTPTTDKSSAFNKSSMSPQKQSAPISNAKTGLDKLKKTVTMMAGDKKTSQLSQGAQPKIATQKSLPSQIGTKKTTLIQLEMTEEEKNQKEFDIENDPDKPEGAVGSNIIIEEIEMNGKKQKVLRKTYQLFDGRTVAITKMMQM
ncbi:UNKNOWN [Stylonychia lemnae]|uniref:SCP domain-containing protein n=1 Tax=Stylonychia lemnae TaxID=5949 RepID=A0A077ZPB5_STYLE|nr:UNKNOWN [Stylonychia lemnae]|eukprot:CDW71758.1 UNKNOWN [Stylonychia lemnae]